MHDGITKDRLKELLCTVACKGDDKREGGCSFRQNDRCNRIEKLDMCMIECVADHLLAEGVIVPPCKVGQTVYAISESRIAECTCYDISIGHEMLVETEHHCDYECKGCPFNSWGQDYSGEYSCQGEYGVWFFKFEDFGKTVFLTREEAEAALAEREGKG